MLIHRRNQNAKKLAVILTLCNEFGDPKTESFGGWIHIWIMLVFDLRLVLPCMFKPCGQQVIPVVR